MTVRLYLTNSAASYVPPTIRGTWGNATNTAASKMSQVKAGASVTVAKAETVSTNNYKVLLRRWVSEPINNPGTFTGGCSIVQMVLESSLSANMSQTFHMFVTVGSTDVVRGVLASNIVSGTEWPTAPVAMSGSLTVTNVPGCLPGDRVVIEIGYNAANTSTSSFTGTAYYGGTGTDLVAGNSSLSMVTRPPWIEFSGVDALFAQPLRNGGTVTTTTGPTTATPSSFKRSSGMITTSTGVVNSLTKAVRKFLAVTATSVANTLTAARHSSTLITTDLNPPMPTTAVHISGGADVETLPDPQSIPFASIEGDIDLPPGDVEVLASFYRPATRKGLRFIAQNIRDGKWLDWDLPLTSPEITYTLSGPTVLKATVVPEYRDIRNLGLDAWSTWIHVEEDGQIRASGILQPGSITAGETLTVEAVGVADYPNDVIYGAQMSEIQIDPLEIVRRIWAQILGYSDAPTGITIAPTTSPIRLGEPEHQDVNEDGSLAYDEETVDLGTDEEGNPVEVEQEPGRYTDSDGNLYEVREDDAGLRTLYKLTPRMVEAKPYELLWFNVPNSGSEIGKLAKDTPFDFVEVARWNADKSAVEHYIDLGYPRLGGDRSDLRFAQDENMTEVIPLQETPDFWASGVVFVGNGQGRDGIYGYSAGLHARRIRRVISVTDKTVVDQTRAQAGSAEELRRRQSILTVGSITISDSHDNAPIGSFITGDDILVQADIPWHGEVALRHRIIAYTWKPDLGEVVIQLRRSEQFAYGRSGSQ